MIHQRRDDCEVFFDVRPRVQQSTGLEQPRTLVCKPVGEHAAAAVLELPPWIGEVDVNRIDRMRLDVALKYAMDIRAENADVFELPPFQPPRGAAPLAVLQFDAQEVAIWMRGPGRDEKHPAAGADVDLNRVLV